MRKLSLAARLVLGGIFIVVAPIAIIGFFSIAKSTDAQTALSHEQVQNVVVKLADLTQVALASELKLAKALSVERITLETASKIAKNKGADSAQDIERLGRHLSEVMKQTGELYESIVVIGTDGIVLADDANGQARGINVSERDYFRAAKSGKANIGRPSKSKKTGNPIVPICVPLKNENGEFIGTVAIMLKIDFLIEKTAGTKVGRTGYAFMADSEGVIIAHPQKELILALDLKTVKGMEAIVSSIMARKTGVESYVFEGIPKIAGFAPVSLTGWSVIVTEPVEDFLESAYAIRNGILLVGGVFVCLTAVLVFFFARSVSKPIGRVVAGLNEGAVQVAAASGEVSSSSQSLAEGASEQAASLEETSSSLEEMASMTKQNAEHANHANTLMKEITRVVDDSNSAMGRLTTSMKEVSAASEETSKIIKNIDEIAFKTNLLALNAAVEAARAGDAGAGFAVVAEEVRNLAKGAAEAAKNTANLIEDTIKKIKEGTGQVDEVAQAFELVATKTGKMEELVAEVAAASGEQAQGIEQVNRAVAEMDKVVQQNAASAEESAAASEQLNAQAEQMKGYVRDLVAVVNGGGRRKGGGPEAEGGTEEAVRAMEVGYAPPAPSAGHATGAGNARRGKAKAMPRQARTPADTASGAGMTDF